MIAVLVIVFVALLLLYTPVAFSMGLASAAAVTYKGTLPLTLVMQRLVTGIDSFVLLAVPFFILAGALMDYGGITARLIRLAKALVGHIRGGLGMVVVVGEIFFSGISGSTAADVSAVGSLLIPSMVKAGYPRPLSVAIVSSASAMGILVPPCILMVVLGVATNTSVAALFAAGFVPAFVMAGLLLALIYVEARRVGLPAEQQASWKELGQAAIDALIPLGMPVIMFGGILGGVVTATEAAVLAVLYGLIVGVFVYREITWSKLVRVMVDSIVASGTVMLLAASASVFAWILATERVPQAIGALTLSLSGSALVFLILSNVVFIVLGGVLEGLPSLLILLPILYPISQQLGVDPIHYGILVIAAVGIGLFLPPVGLGLFIAAGIGGISLAQATRPLIPFLLILCAGLLVITAFPWLTTVVPTALGLGR